MSQYVKPSMAQSPFQANGQGVNKASVLSGLRQGSQQKFDTGTKTGDQAAADFAKGNLYQAQASMGRDMTKKNAEFHNKLQDQKEQLTQQGRQLQMKLSQQQLQQQQAKMQLGFRQATDQSDLMTQWRTGLMGLIS